VNGILTDTVAAAAYAAANAAPSSAPETGFAYYLYNVDDLFRNIYNWFCTQCNYAGIPVIYLNVLLMIIIVVAALAVVSVMDIIVVLMERKIGGRLQNRHGPNRVGWHGALQLIADALKALSKEDIVPTAVDRKIFWLAPVVTFMALFLPFMAIPFARGTAIYDFNIGILYIIAVGSLAVVGVLMAGWGSNNKFSMLGGLRSAAQMISYEIPLVLSVIGVIMMTGSMKMGDIVEAQKSVPFILTQPLGFVIYCIAGLAELNRVPFDIPEGDSEIVGGYHTEYSGMKFLVFYVAEYTNLVVMAMLVTTLFLGGWNGPWLPSYVWFFIKTFFVIFVIIWTRWTLPRLRVDQLMNLGWKALLPLGFLNLIITGAIILFVK
jgi:NADH-quinone oxidoreductase subunit H